ncbi:uncharacterized protein [Blastocystis hominis]|uniref:Uncharacterized protein n=1 Tax=Blastocystis hominis TaxID=12968 RepID=D8M9A9_BLAHO|nr:uncharacterized protein [Blastocystis hominis]CBK24648.2 unnamed protein product [Blastocystis hominis]|eukprot:XP_012898696.1 uncharacterized protein [Blastocystis hominis]
MLAPWPRTSWNTTEQRSMRCESRRTITTSLWATQVAKSKCGRSGERSP